MSSDEHELFRSEEEGKRSLTESAPWLMGRLRFLTRSTPAVVQQVHLGLLFVMAWWSGPARQQWVRIKKLLASLDPSGRLEVVVIDTDGLQVPPGMVETLDVFGHIPLGGWGETFWIRDGVIRAAANSHTDVLDVARHTRELVEFAETDIGGVTNHV